MSTATTTGECTLGEMLRESRLSRGLSLDKVASNAGITPMYLSLIERDACGPPSDEKLQNLAAVLGEQSEEKLFAKAGRVTPQVVNTILRHPREWSELIAAAKYWDADHLSGLKKYIVLHKGSGKTDTAKFMAKFLADHLSKKGSQRKQPSEGKAGLQRRRKERSATPKRTPVSSVRRAKRVRNAPVILRGRGGNR